jgi:hypothetical protein
MKVLQILVLIFGLIVFANAQTTEKAVLSGTVYDVNGAVIPGVNVVFVNQNGKRFETTTDKNGDYWYYLPVSKYESASGSELNETAKLIKYEIVFNDSRYSGFQKFAIKDFILSGKMQLDIVLEAKAAKPTSITDDGETEISDKILQKPSEELPKEQNKSKRKKKNNKQ